MRGLAFLVGLYAAVIIAQAVIIPEMLPPSLRPDLALLVGLASLALLPRDLGLILLFLLGLQFDVLASPRMGLMAFCYLLAAAAALSVERELVEGGAWSGWLAAVAGTGLAHGVYLLAGRLFGSHLTLGPMLEITGYRILAAVLFGGFVAFALAECYAWAGLLSREAFELRQRGRARSRFART